MRIIGSLQRLFVICYVLFIDPDVGCDDCVALEGLAQEVTVHVLADLADEGNVVAELLESDKHVGGGAQHR